MNRLNIDTKLVLFAVGTFLLAYIFTFPLGWLISDVYSYLNQGMAIMNGEKSLTYTDAITNELLPYHGTSYPLGNAFWIAFWSKFFGLKYVYVGSLFSICFSSFLLYKVLAKESFFKLALVLIFVYPSLAFFSNSLMSSVPSFLLVSIFLYGLFSFKESGKKWFLLSFIAAISFWIRETNIVLLGSICLIHFIQDKRWFFHYASGTIIGFIPRLLTSHYYYGDTFHYVLAESFSIQSFINNIGVYAIMTLCFMPLGLLFIGRYRGRYFAPILISSMLYILMYSLYSFNATFYSGFNKGVILMGRFLIPILPIYIISVGWQFRNTSINKWIKIIGAICVSILIVCMQLLIHKEAKIHEEISTHLLDNYNDKLVLYDMSRTTNIVRYINPFHGKLSYISDISNLQDGIFMREVFSKFDEGYIIQSLNMANSDKEKYTSKVSELVYKAQQKYSVVEIEKIKVKPALFIQVLKIKNKDLKDE